MEEKNEGKKFDKRILIYGLIILILIAAGIFLWSKYGKSNEGQVQGAKTENQTETAKTVPESKYFSQSAKVMYFYSDSCHWCQQEKQVLGELGYEGYRFKPMNVGKDTSLWEKYEISGTPTFIGPTGDKLIGYRAKDELKTWLDKELKK